MFANKPIFEILSDKVNSLTVYKSTGEDEAEEVVTIKHDGEIDIEEDYFLGFELKAPKKLKENPSDVTFPIGVAIRLIQEGAKVARKGWNGKGMYIFLADVPEEAKDEMLPSIGLHTTDNKLFIGWVASATDLLAEDWYYVGGEEHGNN